MEDLGKLIINIEPRIEKLQNDVRAAERMMTDTAKRVERTFAGTSIQFNDMLAKKSISDIEQLAARLKAKLQEKIELGAPLAQLETLKNSLNKTEEAVKNFKSTSESGSSKGNVVTSLFGGNFDGGISKFITSMISMGVSILSVQKALAVLSASMGAFEDRKKAILGVDTTIHTMGKEAEYSTEQITRMAAGLADFNKFAVSTNDILGGQATLLNYDAVDRNNIKRLSQLMIDLSAKMKEDLPSAAKLLGLATENLDETFGRLRRSGINFSDSLKEQVIMLKMSGDNAGAAALIYSELERRVGGFARNTTTEFEAFQNRVSASWSAVKRSIGEAIVSIIEAIIPMKTNLDEVTNKNETARIRFETLANTIQRLGTIQNRTKVETEEFNKALFAMDSEFGTNLANLDKEKKGWEAITTAINDSKNALIERSKQAAIAAVAKDWMEESVKKYKELFQLEEKLSDYELKIKNNPANTKGQAIDYASGIAYLKQQIADAKEYIANRAQWTEELNKKLSNTVATQTTITWTNEGKNRGQLEARLAELEKQSKNLVPNSSADIANKKESAVIDKLLHPEKQHESITGIASLQRDMKANDTTWSDQLTELQKHADAVSDVNNKLYIKDKNKRAMVLNQIKIDQDKIYSDMAAAELANEKLTVEAMADGVEKKKKLAEIWEKEENSRINASVKDTNLAEKQKANVHEVYLLKLQQIDAEEKKKELEAQATFLNESKSIDKQMIDARIRNYELSVAEYKAYLDKELDYEIQILEEKNKKREEYNRAHPDAPIGLIDIEAYRTAGKKENESQSGKFAEGKVDHGLSEWKKENKIWGEAAQGTIDIISNGWNQALESWISGGKSFAEATSMVWKNMANQIIEQILRIALQYAMLRAALALFGASSGGFGGFLIAQLGGKAEKGHAGGNFIGTSGGVMKMSSGGSFIVPAGFRNDTFPLMVETGERVSVTPANSVHQQDEILNRINTGIAALNINAVISQNSEKKKQKTQILESRLKGTDIVLSNKKESKIQERYT